jgi:hypothetical protein
MRRLTTTVLALALVAIGAAPALAQDRNRAATNENVTTYGDGAFEPSQVEGTVRRSDLELTRARRLQALGTLVRVRDTFRPEMLKSVENM